MLKKNNNKIVLGISNSITLQEGISSNCFMPHIGSVPLIFQSVARAPDILWKDPKVTFIDEVIALGADAIAMAIGGKFIC